MLENAQEIINDVGPPEAIPIPLVSTDVEMEEGIVIMTNF